MYADTSSRDSHVSPYTKEVHGQFLTALSALKDQMDGQKADPDEMFVSPRLIYTMSRCHQFFSGIISDYCSYTTTIRSYWSELQ